MVYLLDGSTVPLMWVTTTGCSLGGPCSRGSANLITLVATAAAAPSRHSGTTDTVLATYSNDSINQNRHPRATVSVWGAVLSFGDTKPRVLVARRRQTGTATTNVCGCGCAMGCHTHCECMCVSVDVQKCQTRCPCVPGTLPTGSTRVSLRGRVPCQSPQTARPPSRPPAHSFGVGGAAGNGQPLQVHPCSRDTRRCATAAV